jgi:membrane protein required for colicin V production
MNWLDIVIIVVIIFAAFSGLRTGLIKAVLSLAGLIVGVVLAGRYYVPLAQQLTFISQTSVAKVVAFVIILVGVMVIASVIAALLKWAASAIMLGWVNRLGGAVFGLVLGALFCAALLAIWVKFLGIAGVVADSGLATFLLDRFPMVLALLPDEFDAVRSFFQ